MLNLDLIENLSELSSPVLTIYLDTNQRKQTNRGPQPGYLTRLKSQASLIAQTVPDTDRGFFLEQLERTEAFLRTDPPRCEGIVIFAGRDVWKVVPLEGEVADDVHWGMPSLTQMVWSLDEHRPYGIVIVGRKSAQFFLYSLGEMIELEAKNFELPASKEKEMGPQARPGVRMSRGTNRDVYEHHRAAQYAHFHRQIAEGIVRWGTKKHWDSVFLVGIGEMVRGIWKKLPQAQLERITPIEKDLGWVTSRAELQRCIEPIVLRHERERQTKLVNALLLDERGVVLGIDESLAQLQKGRLRNLLVIKDLDADLQRCGECLWVDRTADRVCPACGRERHAVALRDILPELARYYKVSLQVVTGEAGRKLQEAGGMGGWLREFERKEYGQRLKFG